MASRARADPLTRAVQAAGDDGGVVVLGAVDAGKSTWARRFARAAKAEVVDADLGQAWIGPPALVSLGAPGPGDAAGRLRAARFVGSTSPVGHVAEVVAATRELVAEARRPVVVDTDGLVAASAGRAYKAALLRAAAPRAVVLLERTRGELAWYAAEARALGAAVVRAPAERGAAKSAAVRAMRRREGFRRALLRARVQRVPVRDLAFHGTLWNRGAPLRTRPMAEALDCRVVAGWEADGEALAVCRGTPHLVDEAREALGLRELHAVPEAHFHDLLVGLEDARGRFAALAVVRGVDWERGTVSLLTRASRSAFEAVRPGALRLGERFHELEPVRIP